MTYSFQNPSQEQIFTYLKNAKTIAVVGLSSREETAAYRVSKLCKKQVTKSFQSIQEQQVRLSSEKRFMPVF